MSIQSEIDRISGNIEDAYAAAAAKGATMPSVQNSANLAATIQSISTPADYVVEQGTSGGWTYRKWASGVAECWRYVQHSGVRMNTAWTAPIYYYSTVIQDSLPAGLFSSVVSCQYSPDVATGQTSADCWASAASGYPLTTSNTCGIYLLRVGSQATAKAINIYWKVEGRWD